MICPKCRSSHIKSLETNQLICLNCLSVCNVEKSFFNVKCSCGLAFSDEDEYDKHFADMRYKWYKNLSGQSQHLYQQADKYFKDKIYHTLSPQKQRQCDLMSDKKKEQLDRIVQDWCTRRFNEEVLNRHKIIRNADDE